MAIEHWMESLAEDLANERIDLTEPTSDAGHTVADEIIERLNSGATEIASLRARLEWLIDAAQKQDIRLIANPATGFFVNRPGDEIGARKRLAYARRGESFEAAIDNALSGKDADEMVREEIKRQRNRAALEESRRG